MKRYTCDTACFVGGRLYRAGEVFSLQDKVKPAKNMKPVDSGKAGGNADKADNNVNA